MIPSNATPPKAIIAHVEGSGTEATASPSASSSPVMKLALIASPVVALYSPTCAGTEVRHVEVVARQRECPRGI